MTSEEYSYLARVLSQQQEPNNRSNISQSNTLGSRSVFIPNQTTRVPSSSEVSNLSTQGGLIDPTYFTSIYAPQELAKTQSALAQQLATQQFGFQTKLGEQQFGQQTKLGEQQFGFQRQLSTQATQEQKELATLRAQLAQEEKEQGYALGQRGIGAALERMAPYVSKYGLDNPDAAYVVGEKLAGLETPGLRDQLISELAEIDASRGTTISSEAERRKGGAYGRFQAAGRQAGQKGALSFLLSQPSLAAQLYSLGRA